MISVLVTCVQNDLSNDAAVMLMDEGEARNYFFLNKKTQLLKVEFDVNPYNRKCDVCINKATGIAFVKLDTS